jgi:hypothetical protein
LKVTNGARFAYFGAEPGRCSERAIRHLAAAADQIDLDPSACHSPFHQG